MEYDGSSSRQFVAADSGERDLLVAEHKRMNGHFAVADLTC